MLSIILIGLSLSMDAFAVSVSSGVSIPGLKIFHAVRASLLFGLFQFAMPVAGWFLGRTFISSIQAVDHWIAFALLAVIGGKMLWEAGRSAGRSVDGARQADAGPDIRSFRMLLTLALATSIDALAVGVSFSILNQGVWGPALLIGGVTFAVCLTGFEFGRRLGHIFKRGAHALGGFILIGIGIKILIEHLHGS
ncbi:MAG: manganese efflux pump MntP family protein [Spirochaetaceae bacterium]|jgi:putative Mn2+ efflux pump MntP|nr:manganese efflux pump MntP family protein [Spirochaetaceae bacterium]